MGKSFQMCILEDFLLFKEPFLLSPSHSIWNLVFFPRLSNPLTQGHSSVVLMFLKVPSSENTNMNKLDSEERVFI